ncbi:unnamed protein product [Gordionus sp. m RMFG-2023]|uniref:polyadenylate-binding protein 1-like n=1 Tax=Gordionus sp. m RMFG-2023 TaxID=3053472 RepID=UPI0030DF4F09
MTTNALIDNSANEFSIFVGDLSPEVDDTALYLCFALRFPSCSGAKIIRDMNGCNKGFGFVKFTDERQKDKAMADMNGHYGLGSKPIKINQAFQQKRAGYIPDLTYLLHQYRHQHERMVPFDAALHAAQPNNIKTNEANTGEDDDELTKFYKSFEGSTTSSLAKKSGQTNEQSTTPASQADPSTSNVVDLNMNAALYNMQQAHATNPYYNPPSIIAAVPNQDFNITSNVNASAIATNTVDPAFQYYHYTLQQQQYQSMLFQQALFPSQLYPIIPAKDDPNELISYYSNPQNYDPNSNTSHLMNSLGLIDTSGQLIPLAGNGVLDKINEEYMTSQNGEFFDSLERSRWQPIDFQSNHFISLEF